MPAPPPRQADSIFHIQGDAPLLDREEVPEILDLVFESLDPSLVIRENELLDPVEAIVDPIKALIDTVEALFHHDREVFNCDTLLGHISMVTGHEAASNRACA